MTTVKLISDQSVEKWLNLIKHVPKKYQHLPLSIGKRPIGSGPNFTINHQDGKPAMVIIYFDYLSLDTDRINEIELFTN